MPAKHALLTAARVSGLSALARAATAKQLRILCYHGLWITPGPGFGTCLFMDPAPFEDRMRRLKRSGRPVLGLDEAVARLEANDLPPASVVITIDDGWVSTLTHMLPVLERYELPATLYATTWYSSRDLPVINVAVAYLLAMTSRRDIALAPTISRIEALPEDQRLDALRDLGRELGVSEAWLDQRQFHLLREHELVEAHARGLDLQLHTHRHIDVSGRIGLLTGEIDENRAFLERITGERATHFCYPSGTYHHSAPALLAESGVRSATLVSEGLNAPGTNAYALRRFVDGRNVAPVEFDAYLSGTLHYLSEARTLARDIRIQAPRRAAAASSMLICAI
ncbi:polysaccharide deacetylase family protein [Sphingomonas sp. AOB5]|uniref:polysaccharide deacetylase family protein n=1 Tax=Sphingomonas sp. AOB5 TaxID=3034017 RepID=UPI0023F65B5C|nr:polysaccharide deacetylase family protein [Sphingomonas sp. AOB5]MDF7774596.1 polysaccharide deacetylase family protein [Sphingomonas sp. AOB5]